jgi:hypothetical protein
MGDVTIERNMLVEKIEVRWQLRAAYEDNIKMDKNETVCENVEKIYIALYIVLAWSLPICWWICRYDKGLRISSNIC